MIHASAALARSKSTPGLVESSGKVSLQAMALQQNYMRPMESRPPKDSPCSSRASEDSDAHSHSNSDNNAQSTHSRSYSSHHSDDATGYPAGATLTEPDITNSMTVSSITSYITDSSMQKSPLGTEAPPFHYNITPSFCQRGNSSWYIHNGLIQYSGISIRLILILQTTKSIHSA